jgi:hypothetical protein
MSDLNDFLKALNHLVYVAKRVEKQSKDSLTIHFSDLKDSYAISEYDGNSIITLLDNVFIDRDNAKIDEIKKTIMSKIELFQDFYEKYKDQLKDFDYYTCVRSSFIIYKNSYENQNQKLTRFKSELKNISYSLESLCFQYEETHPEIKSLRSKEVRFEKEISDLNKVVEDALIVFEDERNNRIKYGEVKFEKIAHELNEIDKYLRINYLLEKKVKSKYSNDPIFTPEIFGTCHRLINSICLNSISEKQLIDIFENKDIGEKIKLKSSVKEKFYYIGRYFQDFIKCSEEEKVHWGDHFLAQFENVSSNSFRSKGNLLHKDEDFRNDIDDVFERLKKNYL